MDLSVLPRSVRWRIQLGLLRVPDGNVETLNVEQFLSVLAQENSTNLQEQRSCYNNLVETRLIPFEKEEEELLKEEQVLLKMQKEQSLPPSPSPLDLDPLTAMLVETEAKEKRKQELDLKYRRERARRKRGMQNEREFDESDDVDQHYMHTQTRNVILKDLHRLHPEHYTHYRSRDGNTSNDFDIKKEERSKLLEQVLMVHAMEHSQLGYRQGMHEIASYLMLVLEMDLAENKNNTTLLDTSMLLNDTFAMFAAVMEGLGGAYDVASGKSTTSKTPMESMGQSILKQIRNTANDPTLYAFLQKIHVPPQLYCTKWVRLMFSREVQGWRNVILLWDVFFSCKEKLQKVLELTAACMIMLVRTKLLTSSDANDGIHLLMNLDPLESVTPLVNLLRKMMERLETIEEGGKTATMPPLLVGSLPAQAMPNKVGAKQAAPPAPAASTPKVTKESLQRAVSGGIDKIRDAWEKQTVLMAGETATTPNNNINNTTAPQQHHQQAVATDGSASLGDSGVLVNGDPLLGSVPVHEHHIHSKTTSSPRGNLRVDQMAEKFTSSFRRLATSDQVRNLFSSGVESPDNAATPKRHHIEKHLSRQEMADKLHKSVVTIQHHFIKSSTKNEDKTQSSAEVPKDVWEALAEIETVRMHLLRDERR